MADPPPADHIVQDGQQIVLDVPLRPNITPPEQFNFKNPASWQIWKKRFSRYMSVSGMSDRGDAEKIDTLIYIMGEKSEDIYLQFQPLPEPITYNAVLQAFEDYFIPRRNIMFERFKFNSRTQQQGETVDSFITDVHALAEQCEFGAFKDELIRDRIVVGMLDAKLSERLQLKLNLTLQDTITAAKQAEIQQKQNLIIRDKERAEHHVNSVNRNPKQGNSSRGGFYKGGKQNQQYNSSQEGKKAADSNSQNNGRGAGCSYCGSKQFHPRNMCPARNADCFKCKLKGHFGKVCKTKSIRMTENVDDDTNDMFVGCVEASKEKCLRKIHIKEIDKEIDFLADTGADCVCLPPSIIKENKQLIINKTSQIIKGPDTRKLDVIGSVNITLNYKGTSCQTTGYVINGLCKPLLGRVECDKLGIVKIVKEKVSVASIIGVNGSFSKVKVLIEFPKLGKVLGVFPEKISLKLKPGAVPFAQSVPRPVALAIRPKLGKELARLVGMGILKKVTQVTDWVAPIVCVPRGIDEIRICGDYFQVNKSIYRPYHPIPKVELTLASLYGACIYSKIDLTLSFYQVELDEESQLLTTIITPFGRYKFTRLPFGIACASEYLVTKLSKILEGIENVVHHVDDILVFGVDVEDHDATLRKVLTRLETAGITINASKCIIGVKEISFLGHRLSERGVDIDPERVSAINNFPVPTNKEEVMRFLGMVNFTARYIEDRSTVLEPIHSLLKNNVEFIWGPSQEQAFIAIKKALSEAPTLAYFDPTKKMIISADASSYGIGGCLFQEDSKQNREIVAYASKTLTVAEKRYAQIEREALAITWVAGKFEEYVMGLHVVLETDHKPLIQILQSKPIDELSPRLQRLRIRLMRYSYEVNYVPGKLLVIADCLSRGPLEDEGKCELAEGITAYVNFVKNNCSIKDVYIEKIAKEQNDDEICKTLKKFSIDGWPEKSKLSNELSGYYQYRFDITFSENLLLYGSRIVIPASMQSEVLENIHAGHQGIVKCRRRAKESVWWPGLSSQIEILVRDCPKCIEERSNPKEKFTCDDLPTKPWQKISADLFKHSCWYLIVVDNFSRYIEIEKLKSLDSNAVIEKIAGMFSRFGICEELRSDNGPQFRDEFDQFAKQSNFRHVTSSPYYSQSNGEVENAVKIAKNLIKKNSQSDLEFKQALLSYRATPLANGYSPGELMLGRRLRTSVPILPSKLEKGGIGDDVHEKNRLLKEKQARDYDKRHRSRNLSELCVGERVWITDMRQYGQVVKKLVEPRSYLIKSENSEYRRNRWHLIPAPLQNKSDRDKTQPDTSVIETPIDDKKTKHSEKPTGKLGRRTLPTRARNKPNWLRL